MKKHSFKTDFEEGCHPQILRALSESNYSQQAGYGDDEYSIAAREAIQRHIANPAADIYFVSGGTQANLIAISATLRSHEAVISPKSGHIYQHETGAIEATGHRIQLIESQQGKIYPEQIIAEVEAYFPPHTIKPKMVYLTQSTEVGTIYSKAEIEAIRRICDEHDLYLYVDGARLGAALSCSSSDITLAELSQLCDMYYIGGTKNGALLGEAIVINNENLKEAFRSNIKQKGGLLAKGRLLGIQFYELFKDQLFFELASHANAMADKIRQALIEAGITFMTDSPTNQLFPILHDHVIQKLNENYDFYTFYRHDAEHSVIRLVTSWATPVEKVDEFIMDIHKLISK